ncbi:hypothetical protein Tco_1418281 [Tanacetum coccineum]
MSAQTRSGMPPLLDNGTIAALKDALFGQNNGEQRTMQFSRLAKVEFPKFDGADVRGWMFRCEEFFAIEQTADEDVFLKRLRFIPMMGPLAEIQEVKANGKVYKRN